MAAAVTATILLTMKKYFHHVALNLGSCHRTYHLLSHVWTLQNYLQAAQTGP